MKTHPEVLNMPHNLNNINTNKITIFYIYLEFPFMQYHEKILLTVCLHTKDKKKNSKYTPINLK